MIWKWSEKWFLIYVITMQGIIFLFGMWKFENLKMWRFGDVRIWE
jgi:hypothetical protein